MSKALNRGADPPCEHLNYTFALKVCPQPVLGGQSPATRGGAVWFEGGSGVFYRSVRCLLIRLLTREAPGERFAKAGRFESVFSQVRR